MPSAKFISMKSFSPIRISAFEDFESGDMNFPGKKQQTCKLKGMSHKMRTVFLCSVYRSDSKV
jgi:hypothetical protein